MKNNNENIALYIPFNGKAGQTNAKDYSINDHVLTFNGTARLSNNLFYRPSVQSSLRLDGDTADAVVIDNSSVFDLESNDFTIIVTLNRNGSSGRQIFLGKSNSTGDDSSVSFWLEYDSSNHIRVAVGDGTNLVVITGTDAITDDKWRTYRFIRKSNILYLYEDKKLIGSASFSSSIPTTTYKVGIGQGGEYTGANFNGYIQEVLIVNGEAWDDWAFNNSVITGHVNLDDYRQYLVASYPLTESSGDAIDVIGGNTLTDNGGVGSIENFRGELARDFDGSNDIFISDTYWSQGATTMLASFWFKTDVANVEQEIIFSLIDNFGGGIRFVVQIRSDNKLGIGMRDTVDGSAIYSYSTQTVTTNNWYHCLVLIDTINNKQYAYIDQNNWIDEDKIMSTFPTDGGDGIGIGGRPDSATTGSYFFSGELCYLNIYKDITFTDDTERESFVSTLYNNGRANVIELSQQRSDGTFVPAKQYAQRFYDPILDSLQNYLVAYWSGDDLYDRANHHTLTNNNGVTFEDGIHGKAFTLDGVNQSVYAAHDPNLNLGTEDFTISCWIYCTDTSPTYSPLLYFMHFNDSGWATELETNGTVCFMYGYNGQGWQNRFCSGEVIQENTWNSIVFSCVDGTMDIYVNNVSVHTATVNPITDATTAKLYIGDSGDEWDNRYYFAGKIGEAFVLKGYGLSSDEVSLLYNSGVGKFLSYNSNINRPYPAEHLIDVWPLDEASGNRSSIKNSYTASDNNSVGSASGISKPYSALFDGTNYLSVANATYSISSVLATKTWTLGFWYKSAETSNKSLMGCRNASDYGFDIQINSTQGYIDILFDNSVQISTDISCDDDSFKRVIITCTNDLLKLYVNNVLVATKIDSGELTNAAIAFYLGGLNVSGTLTNGFTGHLQEFILLDTPVDVSFIEDDYNEGIGRFYLNYPTILNEDGTTALWEDGSKQLIE